jgi:hypothetical protein
MARTNINTRTLLQEKAAGQTVNDVQLNDLYDAAAKTESQIINLTTMAVKFSNQQVKQVALALKSKASEFTALLMEIMDEAHEPIALEKTPLHQDDKSDMGIIESEMPNSTVGPTPIFEVKGPGKMILALMKEHGFTLKEATGFFQQFLLEEWEKPWEKKEEKEGEEDAEEKIEESEEMSQDDMEQLDETIDLTEAYQMVNSPDFLRNGMFATFHTKVLNSLRESNIPGIKDLVEEMSTATNPTLYEGVMNKIYDYADENGITIQTV